MIRRNTASQTIYLPCLSLRADGVAVTSGASLIVAKDGTESASAGTLTHVAGGVWKYTPTQSETDCAIMGLVLTATDAVPVVLNVVTTAANTQAVAFGANTTTPLTSLGSNAPAGWINAAAIATSALDGKGNWNIGKTGYSLNQTFPTNFANLSIDDTGKVTTANPATDGGEIIVEPTELDSDAIAAIAAAILANPANKLVTNSSGEVVASNMRGTDNAALATELAKVIKTGEQRTISRSGQSSITFTETRA